MIHINTLSTKLNRPISYRTVHYVIRAKDEALVNSNGVAMIEEVKDDDHRAAALDAFDELLVKEASGSKVVGPRLLPVTYQRALSSEMYDMKPLMNFVAKFGTMEAAKRFMKHKNLWFPHYKAISEKQAKIRMAHAPLPVTDKLRSKPMDWQRRGMMIPVGHFKGASSLNKFHRKNRMLRDQAAAHFRHMGVFNPSRQQINELFDAQIAPING